MKKLVFIAALAAATAATGQNNWGLGIRLGDPSGLTLKKYMSGNALELSLGRTRWFYGRGWYNKNFNKWYNKQKFNYSDFQYLGYTSSVPVGFQVHYLFQKNISNIGEESISGLDWYFGFGGQLRFQNYTYDYRYKLQGDPNWYYSTGDRVADIDLGGDGVIGLEYTFEGAPVSIFLDLTLFMEVVDDPFLFWFQGGLGARYNF